MHSFAVAFTSVSLKLHRVLDFGCWLGRHRPTGPRVEVMRPDWLDVSPTLTRTPGYFTGRAGHATVHGRRWSTRHVQRGSDGHAHRARPGPLFCCNQNTIIIIIYLCIFNNKNHPKSKIGIGGKTFYVLAIFFKIYNGKGQIFFCIKIFK